MVQKSLRFPVNRHPRQGDLVILLSLINSQQWAFIWFLNRQNYLRKLRFNFNAVRERYPLNMAEEVPRYILGTC